MRIPVKAGLAAGIALALVALGAPLSASAHTPKASLNCDTLTVELAYYDRDATATVVLDGVTLREGTFGGTLSATYPTGGGNTEHHAIVTVKSFDDLKSDGTSKWDYRFDVTTSGCYTAPPKTEVTGGVAFTDTACIDNKAIGNGLVVTPVAGVVYSYSLNGGAPSALPAQSYDDSAIVPGSYVITAAAQDPLTYAYVGTASWSHVWAAPLTDEDCAPVVIVPEQPAPIVTEASSTSLDCEALTATEHHSTTTTTYVYVEESNSWVKGEPVTVDDEPVVRDVLPGECPTVIEPPVETPPVETPPATLVTPAAPSASVDRLATTGASVGAAPLFGGGLALFGLGMLIASTMRRSKTDTE